MLARAGVLIIDDDRIVADALGRMLRTEYVVTIENDAELALERLVRGERFDAILCDLMMEKMSGMVFHARASEVAPDQLLRIVFISGGAYTREAQRFLASVENTCLDKPVFLDTLRDAVASAIARSVD